MLKLADWVDDKNDAILHEIFNTYKIPEFVKQADAPNTIDTSGLPSHLFADPLSRKFPVHTKTASLWSNIYFNHLKATGEIPSNETTDGIAANLEKAAGYWSLTGVLGALVKEINSKQASMGQVLEDSDFAIVDTSSDPPTRLFPVPNDNSVKVAATYLQDNFVQFPMGWRQKAAEFILTKSAEYGVELETEQAEFLSKVAGHGESTGKEVFHQLDLRRHMVGRNSELGKSLYKRAKTILLNKPTQEVLAKTAELMETVDRDSGLEDKYFSLLQPPELACFGHTVNELQIKQAEFVELTNGSIYKKEDFQKLAVADIAAGIDPETAAACAGPMNEIDPNQAAQVLSTLPRDHASRLDRVMKAKHIHKQPRDVQKE